MEGRMMIFTAAGTQLLLMFLVQLALLSNILVVCTRSSTRKRKQQQQQQLQKQQAAQRQAVRQPFNSLVSERSVKNVKPKPQQPQQQSVKAASVRTASKLNTPSTKDKRRVAPPASPSLEATQKSMRATPKKQTNQAVTATPGQPPLQLVDHSGRPMKLAPTVLRWKPDGGIQTVSIQNMSQNRQAVKVKCSDNQLYRVNPVYSFIEPGTTLAIDILRQNGPAKVDKMIFVTAKADVSDNSPYVPFEANRPSASMVLPLITQTQTA